jgi:methylenetetrahydrofolate dehydrogenase (NAD+)
MAADEAPSFGSYSQHPNVVDVHGLAQSLRQEVRTYTSRSSTKPKLIGIMADRSQSNNPQWRQDEDDAEIYSINIEETLREDGLEYELMRCPSNTIMDVEHAIRQANARSDVHGILVFYPIFKRDKQFASVLKSHGPYLNSSTGVFYKTHDDYLRDIVSHEKDVEALGTGYNARWLFRARKQLLADPYIPCTVQAVLKILETYHSHGTLVSCGTNEGLIDRLATQRWTGVTATVINRSEILGRPLAALMALQGANVYSVDESSVLQFLPGGRLRRCHQTLQECLKQSTIVVTAVPSANFTLPSDCIQEGTTVVNVIDERTLLERPNVKLVAQVGSCTVAALEQNLVRLHRQHISR